MMQLPDVPTDRAPLREAAIEDLSSFGDADPGYSDTFDDASPAEQPHQGIVAPPSRSRSARELPTVGILLNTSAPQTLDGSLSVSVIKTDVRSRSLSALAAVLNRGKTFSPKTSLRFAVEGGGTQRVTIPELRPGETHNVRVRIRMPRRDRPQAISVTFLDRRYTGGARATQ